ncbi:MAG: hypothetical protein JKP96_06590 [Oceanicaulis sp.]|jgi:hypothetical protein|nr:hypothetical protein [Oceanicaulis sp.]
MTIKPRIVTKAEDIAAAAKEAREGKDWTHGDADDYAGLAHGHTSKLEGFDRKWGKSGVYFGFPIYCLLEAVGLRVVVMPIEEAEALCAAAGENTTRDVTLLKRGGNMPVKAERATCSMIRRPQLTRPNL